MCNFNRYAPKGLTGKYKRTPSVTRVLAGPIINRILLTKTKTRLIKIAIDAFKTFLIIGKGICFILMHNDSNFSLILGSVLMVISSTTNCV